MHYLGEDGADPRSFVYGAITLCGARFRVLRLNLRLCNCPLPLRRQIAFHNPRCAAPAGGHASGLFLPRSLATSGVAVAFISRATKMFQFARLPPTALWIQAAVASVTNAWFPNSGMRVKVASPGHFVWPRHLGCIAGIHRVP